MAKPASFGLRDSGAEMGRATLDRTFNGRPDGAARPGASHGAGPEWKDGDRVDLSYKLGPRIVGHFGNAGRAALAWGPFVLAYDRRVTRGCLAVRDRPGPREYGPDFQPRRPRFPRPGCRPRHRPFTAPSSRSPMQALPVAIIAFGCVPRV